MHVLLRLTHQKGSKARHSFLFPLAYCDFTIPDSVAPVEAFEVARQPGVTALHKLDKTAQCELFKLAFDRLVITSIPNLSQPEINQVEVSLHEQRAPNDPLKRCGITVYVRIKLECNASMPVFPSDISHTIFIRDNLPDSKPTSRACTQAR